MIKIQEINSQYIKEDIIADTTEKMENALEEVVKGFGEVGNLCTDIFDTFKNGVYDTFDIDKVINSATEASQFLGKIVNVLNNIKG